MRQDSLKVLNKRIDYLWIDNASDNSSRISTNQVIVFLHEGLGSIAMWKKFPSLLVKLTNSNAFVYSRHGHGSSEKLDIPRNKDYLRNEAIEILPKILDFFGIKKPILVGHSDGASIALIYASKNSHNLAGLIAIAPHVFVEELTLSGIRQARTQFQNARFREKLSAYHTDTDDLFSQWSNVWLSTEFGEWNIVESLSQISTPLLIIQGENDQYGSLSQITAIENTIPFSVEKEIIPNCGHSPHLEYPDQTLEVIKKFLDNSCTTARAKD
ncbi:MAG: hypothetical protein CMK56_02460 [Proteobacteria bacterium]|nr:hypothetical protein [Pseudomonadota bacterium]